ncbi:hypothetical protein JMN32_08370 [Fulvivirga sp. 29W222]|uniref:Uncharacterized protein n=1 Tax=Fulvivirga marina TaxID=2494733 RepID=A0A937FUF9_9BACT|nr:hypothetical protein [Fulvivirga marina]MBL6446320.1 hypothetical protein [Fulvivirga marina]
MIKTIKFNPNGEDLKVSFKFEGLIVASYSYTLWETNSNNRVVYEKGNNQNPDDDSYVLPPPVASCDGRMIQLRTEFKALDPENVKQYTITAEVFQGDQSLGKDEDAGDNTGKSQSSLIYILLSKQ